MQIVNGEFYHIHQKSNEDDKWFVGNEIIFDKMLYNVFFSYYVNHTLTKTDKSISSENKIKEYSMLIRELIYEEVRVAHFSELPSRRHCIWLCNATSLPLWKNTLSGDIEVFKVLATGNLHECYAGALEDDDINYKILYEKANAYWRGDCIGNPMEKEYLLEGSIKIIEKL